MSTFGKKVEPVVTHVIVNSQTKFTNWHLYFDPELLWTHSTSTRGDPSYHLTDDCCWSSTMFPSDSCGWAPVWELSCPERGRRWAQLLQSRAGRCCCEPIKARLTNFTITIVVSKHIMKHSLFQPTRMLTHFYSICLSGNGPSPPLWNGTQFWRKCPSGFSSIDLWFSCHVCATASRLQISANAQARHKGAANYVHTSQRKYNFHSWLVSSELHLQKCNSKKKEMHYLLPLAHKWPPHPGGEEKNSDGLASQMEATGSTFPYDERGRNTTGLPHKMRRWGTDGCLQWEHRKDPSVVLKVLLTFQPFQSRHKLNTGVFVCQLVFREVWWVMLSNKEVTA